MSTIRSRAVGLAACVAVIACAGCAGRAPAVDDVPVAVDAAPVARALPDWVRMVPPNDESTAYYVGSAGFAENAEVGLELALGDALSQIENKGRKEMSDIASVGLSRSDVATVAVERQDFRLQAADIFAGLLDAIAVREKSYSEPCEGAGPDGPVCRTFAMVTIGLREWRRAEYETFVELGRRMMAAERENLASIAGDIARQMRDEGAGRDAPGR